MLHVIRSDVSGRFFDGMREARAHAAAYDPKAPRKLREVSVELTGQPADVAR